MDIEVKLLESGFNILCSGCDDFLDVFTLNLDPDEAAKIRKLISQLLKVDLKCISIYWLPIFPLNETGKITYKDLKNQKERKLA